MAKLIFLRHAHSSANSKGILAGRISGVNLSENGRLQASSLIDRLGNSDIDYIYSSPIDRCLQTIQPWMESPASQSLKSFELSDDLIEMDYGTWSGRKLTSLSREKLWKEIQTTPSRVQFPQGEKFTQMQKRAQRAIATALSRDSRAHHLFISHGDVIKSMVATQLGMKLNDFQRLVVDPASITIFEGDATKMMMTVFNDTSGDVSTYLSRKNRDKKSLGGGAGRK